MRSNEFVHGGSFAAGCDGRKPILTLPKTDNQFATSGRRAFANGELLAAHATMSTVTEIESPLRALPLHDARAVANSLQNCLDQQRDKQM